MSEAEKADIVERLRKNAEQMYVNELRSDAADAGIYRSWKNTATEAAAEIERLRALPSRSDVMEAAAKVAEAEAERAAMVKNYPIQKRHFWARRSDAVEEMGRTAENVSRLIARNIRTLKKDTDNG